MGDHAALEEIFKIENNSTKENETLSKFIEEVESKKHLDRQIKSLLSQRARVEKRIEALKEDIAKQYRK